MKENNNNIEKVKNPEVILGERPLKCFISSVMEDKYEWVRKKAISTLDKISYAVRWAFEFTPGGSERIDNHYLRHVRESDFVFWLVTSKNTTAVSNEVREAVLNNRRLLVFLIESPDKWSAETKELIDYVGSYSKWIDCAKFNSLKEAIQMTWADEVVRAIRSIPGMERSAQLEIMAKESRARCIARWMAAGVLKNEAIQLVDNFDIGKPPPEAIPTSDKPLIILTSEFGSGKSLIAERLLQQIISDTAKAPNGPIPNYLQAQQITEMLEKYVLQSTKALGNPKVQGVFLIIDGADETRTSKALQIINEARIIVESWPNTRILITSRPLPDIAKAEEVWDLEELTEKYAYNLINIVAKRDVPISISHQFPKSVKEAIKRPLFAILVGQYIRENQDRVPRSTGELLSTLVENSLSASKLKTHITHPVLCNLAVALMDRGGGLVPLQEIGNYDIFEELTSSGLIVYQNKAVGFPLPILTQWFAAQALGKELIDVKKIGTSSKLLDRWKYPLIIALGIFDYDKVASILEPIVKIDPAIASEIVEEGLAEWGLANDIFSPPSLVAAKQIRDAMQSWINGVGNISKLIAPINKNNKLMPIGAKSNGPMLLTGWYAGTEDYPPCGELPPSINIFSSQFDWVDLRSARPGRQSAWVWRWTRDELVSNLYNLLDKRRLRTNIIEFLHEELWYSAIDILKPRPFYSEDIDLNELKKKLSIYPKNATLVIGNGSYDLKNLWLSIEQYEKINKNVLKSPYHEPDINSSENFIWSPYSHNQLLLRTQAVYKAALEIYFALVKEWFGAFSKRLLYFASLPAILKGFLYIPNGQNLRNSPIISWYLSALPRYKKTIIDISLSATKEHFKNFNWTAETKHLHQLRPETSEWIYTTIHSSLLDVFHRFPAKELAYSWLSSDLERIHWLDRTISRRLF